MPTEALALAVQGVDKVWSWTVRWRSADDVVSDAAASAFRIIWPVAPTLDGALTPNDTDSPIDLPTTPAVTDTTLKWSPVPGAVKYRLVYVGNDFADASKRVVDETVRTTRYSPLGNELNNASYWWRVRPVYPGESQFGEWSEVWRFQRKWGAQDRR